MSHIITEDHLQQSSVPLPIFPPSSTSHYNHSRLLGVRVAVRVPVLVRDDRLSHHRHLERHPGSISTSLSLVTTKVGCTQPGRHERREERRTYVRYMARAEVQTRRALLPELVGRNFSVTCVAVGERADVQAS